MHRLFVGLRLPAAERTRLLAATGGAEGARWQRDDQLHVTLRFIGEVERPMAEDVAAILAQVGYPRFEIAIDGVGVFDRGSGRPTALWAGIRPYAAIAELHRKIDRALVRAGLEPERRAYLPHVTLARIGRGGADIDRWIADHAALAGPPFTVEHFTLFESHLGREGAIYDAVARYALE